MFTCVVTRDTMSWQYIDRGVTANQTGQLHLERRLFSIVSQLERSQKITPSVNDATGLHYA